ncbi:UNVERIFIED_CONTAM: bradyzoite rhoptry protein BRP1 [Hammondia hammondi]|eukprot:XP_008883506.1 bradyzoite rhoptry protein BRP1 [Hammondia hammondi]
MERASAAAATRSPIFASGLTKRKPLLLLLGFTVVLTFFTCGVPTTSLLLRGPKFTLSDLKRADKEARDWIKEVEDAQKKHKKAKDAAENASGSKKAKLEKGEEKARLSLEEKLQTLKQKCQDLNSVKDRVKDMKGLSDKDKKDFKKEEEKVGETLRKCGTAL